MNNAPGKLCSGRPACQLELLRFCPEEPIRSRSSLALPASSRSAGRSRLNSDLVATISCSTRLDGPTGGVAPRLQPQPERGEFLQECFRREVVETALNN